jgi:Xaa-Pro aminopeptidase
MQIKTCARSFVLLPLLLAASAYSAAAQTRDHLTPQEVDLIKDAQALNLRTNVFIKAAERRMALVTGTVASTAASNSKQAKKDAELWGEVPKGTRAELIGDVAKILDEAITNIDDVSMHDEKSPLLPKALRKLAASATQIIDQLTPLRSQAKSEEEIANMEQAVENAQSIIAAAKKLPPAATEKEKKEKSKSGTPKEKP